jgi:hypothetical protein
MRPRAALIITAILISAALLAYTERSASSQNPLASATRLTPTTHNATVREVARAGSYTYMAVALDTNDPTSWIVVMGQGAVPGQQIKLTLWARYATFKSARLGRTFSPLYLATTR